MPSLITLVLLSQTACTSLEERVEIFDAEWCLDIDDESDPDHKGAPRRASAECFLDGDTFKTVGCGDTASAWEEIRLLGPDTPEKAGAPDIEEDECYAQEASAFLERVLQGRSLQLEFDEQCVDKFDRRLAYVFITVEVDDPLREEIESYDGLVEESDGPVEVLVNEWMLRAGLSDLWEFFDDGRYANRLFEARERAALAGEGGWSACDDFHNG